MFSVGFGFLTQVSHNLGCPGTWVTEDLRVFVLCLFVLLGVEPMPKNMAPILWLSHIPHSVLLHVRVIGIMEHTHVGSFEYDPVT